MRIIGGRWRGRRLRFANVAGLRPTADRNRETLFNWLQSVVPGSRCLDLFAGSGALGLEAASRGAAHVLLVEQAGVAVRALRESIDQLQAAEQVELRPGDALDFLRSGRGGRPRFDVVFLDPPFAAGLLEPACRLLAEGGWLAPGARVYLEVGRKEGLPPLRSGWEVLRQRASGQVLYALIAISECENRFETDPG
ncbi:MAG: 16S rRNA (guanine(966)-N(2))-methyltransferase RsmD [Ectothiorhodospiraceae bacterium]|nr:16S rRNA (guanine(966)-N(2))-methyltransferase RsmD [Ectothiorhodospiraceae bacterium]